MRPQVLRAGLSYRPQVARVSIELTTSALWARRSGQLSYLAVVGHLGVEPSGYLLIRQAPSTGWAVASGSGAI
jgi:hypothetical protein